MNYIGNKNIPGVIHKIVNEIPLHTDYLELFAGSGAVGLELPPGHKVFNDLNRDALQLIKAADPTAYLISMDFADILKLYSSPAGNTKDTFIFVDPPYLHSTRDSAELYEFELSDDRHIELIQLLRQATAKVMLIHPECELYNTSFKDWRSIEIKIRYNVKTSIERLWMNYGKQELQTYKFLGADCWERQSNKRKAQRFLLKGQHLPFNEGNYITDMLKLNGK